jgi:excisionase family DNA binding protein
MNNPENWISMKHACEYADVSSRTIHRAMVKGQVRFVKVGRLVRFKKIWLDAWMMGFGPRPSSSQKLIIRNIS